jgi:hypothetical protein
MVNASKTQFLKNSVLDWRSTYMVDAKKVLSVTAGFVGAAGLATLATGANTVSASTGTVNYKSGATTVWNSPSWHQVKRYVTFGDKVQVLGQKVDRNGATWYKVGDNQWIPGIVFEC